MARTVTVHMVPVETETETKARVPGWLVLARKKRSKVARHFYLLDQTKCRWDGAAKAWFVDAVISEEMLHLIEQAYVGASVIYCFECNQSKPCRAWKDIDRVYRGRTDGSPVDDPAGSPRPSPEPPPKPPPRPTAVPSAWWEVFDAGVKAAEAAKAYVPPLDPAAPYIPTDVTVIAFSIGALGKLATFAYQRFARPKPEVRQVPAAAAKGMGVAEAVKILAVPWPCTIDQVQGQFRKALFVAHPDRGGSDAAMARINEARNVLTSHLKQT